MQAGILRILESAQFDPKQARALAEAIEEEVKATQFVTIPFLEAKVSDLKLAISELENRMFNKMVVLGLTGTGIIVSAFIAVLEIIKR